MCEKLLEFGHSCACSFLWHFKKEGILAEGVMNQEVVIFVDGNNTWQEFLPKVHWECLWLSWIGVSWLCPGCMPYIASHRQ